MIAPDIFPLQQPVSHHSEPLKTESQSTATTPVHALWQQGENAFTFPHLLSRKHSHAWGLCRGPFLFHETQADQVRQQDTRLGRYKTFPQYNFSITRGWKNWYTKKAPECYGFDKKVSAGSWGTGWKTISWNLEWLQVWGGIFFFVCLVWTGFF